jgi:hypothetical protein
VLAKPIAWVVGDQGGKQLVFYGVRAILGTVSAASEVRSRSRLPDLHHALRLAHALASCAHHVRVHCGGYAWKRACGLQPVVAG